MGRFSIGLELAFVQASVSGAYYYREERHQELTPTGPVLGLRIGYIHWLSDQFGLVLNGGPRIGAGFGTIDSYYYGSLAVRAGVSWRI